MMNSKLDPILKGLIHNSTLTANKDKLLETLERLSKLNDKLLECRLWSIDLDHAIKRLFRDLKTG